MNQNQDNRNHPGSQPVIPFTGLQAIKAAEVMRKQAEGELGGSAKASPALRAIDPDELETRFAALRASNFVVRGLCDSKGYDLRGLLDSFSGRPDLYEQVLDKLQVREVTIYVDEASALSQVKGGA